MVAYIINEDTTDQELDHLSASCNEKYEIKKWPDKAATLPTKISIGILIIRENNTPLEEGRVILLVGNGIRIVCVFIEPVADISELARKYCSTKINIQSGGLLAAIQGGDEIQQDHEGKPAPTNPQKRHTC